MSGTTSTTDQIKRTWPMLPWKERARFIGQTLGAASNAVLPALVPIILSALQGWEAPSWVQGLAVKAVGLVAAGFGVFLLFMRPGSEAWRPKR